MRTTPSLLLTRTRTPSLLTRSRSRTLRYSTSATTPTPTTTTLHLQKPSVLYCQNLVRLHDYENYLASFFFPAPLRPYFWAIRAFNIELALIRESVKDPTIGKMRMVFWKDTLDKMSKGSPPDQPVAKVLSAAITQHKLSSIWFKRIVQAREDNLADKQFMSIADLETYSENTASSLLYLELELLGVKNVQADHIASHIGKSIGIATILRGTAFHARNKRVYLPADICAKHGLSAEEIIRTGPSEKLNDTIFEIATTANDHLITARTHYNQTNPPPTSAFPVFLSAVPTTAFLNKLESTNFNIFDLKILSREATLPWKLWKSNWLKKF